MNDRIDLPDESTEPLRQKKILITGARSYIGESVKKYLCSCDKNMYSVDILDTMGLEPSPNHFKGYDVVFNVAGIAHIKETDENRHLYFDVNRDLAVKIAVAARDAGVEQFILLSSMSVYGRVVGNITKETKTNPVNAYGLSKIEADKIIEKMSSEDFVVSILRPPMVYGRGCKGNYQKLRMFALKAPVFPKYKNKRSMIYIDNLSEFVKRIIDRNAGGLFFPQNAEYVNTSEMVKLVSKYNGKRLAEIGVFNWVIRIIPIGVFKKVFGTLCYEKVDLVSKVGFEESIRRTEIGG